jgi:hypothetical protein
MVSGRQSYQGTLPDLLSKSSSFPELKGPPGMIKTGNRKSSFQMTAFTSAHPFGARCGRTPENSLRGCVQNRRFFFAKVHVRICI